MEELSGHRSKGVGTLTGNAREDHPPSFLGCPLYPRKRILRAACMMSAKKSVAIGRIANEPRDANHYSISGLAAGNTMLNTDP